MIRYFLMVVVCLSFMTGCATPYGRKGFMGGYDDTVIGKGRYLVTFEGNGYTSGASVRAGALKRAQELCTNEGYQTFRVLDNERDENTQVIANWNQNSGNVNTITRHSVSIIIQCIREDA